MNFSDEMQSAMPSILARAKQEALAESERVAINEARKVLAAEASRWAHDVLAPELRARLELMRPEMIAQCEALATELGAVLGKAILDQLEEKLANSWKRQELLKALLG